MRQGVSDSNHEFYSMMGNDDAFFSGSDRILPDLEHRLPSNRFKRDVVWNSGVDQSVQHTSRLRDDGDVRPCVRAMPLDGSG